MISNKEISTYIKGALWGILLSTLGCTSLTTDGQKTQTTIFHPPKRIIWSQLRNDFNISAYTQKSEVQYQINRFSKDPSNLETMMQQASPYLSYVVRACKERNIPAEVALIPIVESGYRPTAHSKVGASGLWQMMPGTASAYKVPINWWFDGRRDLHTSTQAAMDYMQYLYKRFNRNWLLAIAAYDAGEGRIAKAIRYNKKHNKSVDFWSLPLPDETKKYIPKLLAIREIVKNPNKYQHHLPTIYTQLPFTSIEIDGQVDLYDLSQQCQTPIDDILEYNHGYKRAITPPENTKVHLYFKKDIADNLAKCLTNIELIKKHPTLVRYTVKKGDTLDKLAQKYNSTRKDIMMTNHLKNSVIRISHHIMIPKDSKKLLKNIYRAKKMHHVEQLPGPKQIIYEVKNGDTLSNIAKKLHTKVSHILYWNHLRSSDSIQPQQKIVVWKKFIPKYYTVKSGDTLSHIAARYHTRVKDIKHLNHLKSNTIRKGQKIRIPRRSA